MWTTHSKPCLSQSPRGKRESRAGCRATALRVRVPRLQEGWKESDIPRCLALPVQSCPGLGRLLPVLPHSALEGAALHSLRHWKECSAQLHSTSLGCRTSHLHLFATHYTSVLRSGMKKYQNGMQQDLDIWGFVDMCWTFEVLVHGFCNLDFTLWLPLEYLQGFLAFAGNLHFKLPVMCSLSTALISQCHFDY